MTKQILLATAAAAAMAFAGTAGAGDITGTVGGTAVSSGSPKVIASEAVDPTTGAGAQSAIVAFTNSLTNDINIADGSVTTFNVTFDIEGATFAGVPEIQALSVGGAEIGTGTTFIDGNGDLFASITIDRNGANSGAVTIDRFVVVDGAGDDAIITATSAANISVGSTVAVVSGGTTVPIDTAAATTVVTYGAAFNGFTSVGGEAEATLPNYTSFGESSSATLATGIRANAITANRFPSLGSNTAVTLDSLIDSVVIELTGTAGANIDDLNPVINGQGADEESSTDTAATFTFTDGSLGALITTGASFAVNNNQPVVLDEATYSLAYDVDFEAGFVDPTADFGPTSGGAITLEGTNFDAPWVALNSTTTTSTIRIANTGSVETGPIFVTLQSANVGATGQRVQVTNDMLQAANGLLTEDGGIAPGRQISIIGSRLAAATALNTTASNGDIQVTVQGDGTVLSAKLRNTNTSGSSFEASLGNLEEVDANQVP